VDLLKNRGGVGWSGGNEQKALGLAGSRLVLQPSAHALVLPPQELRASGVPRLRFGLGRGAGAVLVSDEIRRRMEVRVLEACIIIEAWYHGSYRDDRQALRAVRTQLLPVLEWLNEDTERQVFQK
jgi:hypothetical protein